MPRVIVCLGLADEVQWVIGPFPDFDSAWVALEQHEKTCKDGHTIRKLTNPKFLERLEKEDAVADI